ncbi:Aminoacyl-tRNA editing domain protein [uncultured archaeon]|nr:Aminoacyl-tRNA editing domain protein [uncultured archaeon]
MKRRHSSILRVVNMKLYEEKLKRFIAENGIDAEHLSFQQSCHSVEEAALAVNAKPEDFVKNICMIGPDGRLIVAIVKGEDRASTSRVAQALKIERPRIATPEEMLERTGYPCGGTPSFGYAAEFLIDQRVLEKENVYSGGGSENSLVRIPTKELQRVNNGTIARVRK